MPESTRPRLLLLDGHSLAYRAFFALPVENFSTTTGQHTNAVYGFTSMLVNVLRDEQPTHVGVAFDVSRQTFRLEQYSDYKAKRNKTPDEFSSQLPLIRRVLDALAIKHLDLKGYEADDIIATLVTDALADGMEVLILTGDRDVGRDLVAQHVDQHRGEAVDGVGVLPRGGGEVLHREGEERPVGQGVAVQQQEAWAPGLVNGGLARLRHPPTLAVGTDSEEAPPLVVRSAAARPQWAHERT